MGQALDNVHRIYMEGIAGGEARAAVTQYTGHRYTQHSTGVGDGVEGFLAFFEPFVARNPKRDIEIVRSFQDGRWVFCSAYQSLNEGAARWVTMDMFYTDADGLILEHWDTIAAYEEGMVDGPREVDSTADDAANKDLVLEYTKQVLQEGKFDRMDRFVAPDLVQHAPGVAAGRDGLAAWLSSPAVGTYEFLFQLIGCGDFVLTYSKRRTDDAEIAVFDLYRVKKGLIVEQWSNAEEISPREMWGNSGKF